MKEEIVETMQNAEVIQRFFAKNWKGASRHLFIRKEDLGYSLVNYSTPIAFWLEKGDKWFMNKDKYSRTTSAIQSQIRFKGPDDLKEVTEEELDDIMDNGVKDEETPVFEGLIRKAYSGKSIRNIILEK